jgi:hypothetical protein
MSPLPRSSTTVIWRCDGSPAALVLLHRFEHALLVAYWAVSGYGLRASRALLALVIALAVATVLFATVGFGHTQQTVYLPIRSAIPNQPVAYKQTTVPDGKPGVRDAAYYSVQSATSLLREPTSEPSQPSAGSPRSRCVGDRPRLVGSSSGTV